MTVYNERKAKKRGNKGHMVQKREQDKAEKKSTHPFEVPAERLKIWGYML